MGSLSEEVRPRPGFWESVREAVRGTEQDFTEGSLSRAILLLSIPMVLEMAMESLFALVDVFFVARLGAEAAAAVGLTEALMAIFYAIALGLGMATTAMVARRIGEKREDQAAVAAVQGIVLGAGVSLAIGVAGVALAPRLLEWMGASPATIAGGHRYTAIILGGNIAVMMLFLMNAVFRGAGDAAIAMRVLWVANGINIVLDPCLIFGWGPFPALGVSGAAVATVVGRSLGVAVQAHTLLSGRGRVRVERRHLAIDRRVLARLLRVSLSGMGQFLIANAAWIGLVRIVANFGSTAVAGYTIAIRVIMVTLLPAWGMANAAATLVGQNLGAARPARAEQSVWRTGLYNMVFLGLVGAAFVLFAEPVIRWFTSDAEVVRHGVACLRYVSGGYLFYAWGMVIVQAFNGAGDTTTPLVINVVCYWLWQIPLAYGLALALGLGPTGVYLAVAIAESTIAVAGVLVFRAGKWKEQKI
jgi:putative MATE family efflux protein